MTRDAESLKLRTARLLKNIINRKVLFLLINALTEAEKAITL